MSVTFKRIVRYSAMCAAIAGAQTVAQAQVAQFSGDTTGDPTFDRPNTGAPPTSTGGQNQFEAFNFRVRKSGSYQFDLTGGTNYDTYGVLYRGGFNPNRPLDNAVAADDDAGPGVDSRIIANLNAQQQHTFVTSAFGGVFGTYVFSLAGPGQLVLSDAEVATGALQSGRDMSRLFLSGVGKNALAALGDQSGSYGSGPALTGAMNLGMGSIKDDAPVSRPGRNIWAVGYGSFNEIDPGNKVGPSGYENSSGGVIFGGDIKVSPNAAFGLAGAVGESHYSVEDINGEGDVTNVRLAAYGGVSAGTFYATGIAGYGYDDVDTERSIISLSKTKGDTQINEFLAQAELGTKLPLGGLKLNPFAGVQFGHQKLDSFQEKQVNNGTLPLSIRGDDDWWAESSLGVRLFGRQLSGPGYGIWPSFSAAWVHNFSDAPEVKASIVGSPAFVSLVDGAHREEDLARVEGELTAGDLDGLSASVGYSGEFGEDTLNHVGHGSIRYRW